MPQHITPVLSEEPTTRELGELIIQLHSSTNSRIDSVEQSLRVELHDALDKQYERIMSEVGDMNREMMSYIDERFAEVDRRFEKVDERFEAIDMRFEAMDQRFENLENRFESMEYRFDTLERTLTFHVQESDAIHRRQDAEIQLAQARCALIEKQNTSG